MEKHIDIYIGKRLKQIRIIQRLNQKELGEKLGITFQQIQKYERGVNRISAGRIYDLANIFHVPISYFFDGFGVEMHKTENGISYGADILNRENLELLCAFCAIDNPILRKRVVDLIKSMNNSVIDAAE